MSRCTKCKNKKCSCDDDCHCPEESSSSTLSFEKIHDECFKSLVKCPEGIPTRRFSSPNSPLPLDKLDELQLCIEEANDLLRSLGAESDPENKRQLQLHLLSLQGICIKAKIKCVIEEPNVEAEEITEVKIEEKVGILATAGRNFIQLNSVGKHVFILYERIISLSRVDCEKLDHQEQAFIDADRCTRRELVLNFGDFVSKRPELVNLFFGLPLHIELLNYLGKDIRVETADNHVIVGTLFKVGRGRIQIENRNGPTEIIMYKICFLEVIDS